MPDMRACAFMCVMFTRLQVACLYTFGPPLLSVCACRQGSVICAHLRLRCEHIVGVGLCYSGCGTCETNAVLNAVLCVALPPLVCGTRVITMLGHTACIVRLCGHVYSQHSLSRGCRCGCSPSRPCTQRRRWPCWSEHRGWLSDFSPWLVSSFL